jgi:hypothetical protein
MPEYQVFHQQAVKSFSAGEDNEHQRRWTESQWEAKASNKKFNYDKSRAHLNFEIVKGGKIVPLGSSKPILERFQDRLEATGAEDPNKGLETPKYRIACNMIFSGDADRMREMAFGDQNVERAKGADNSHVKRKSGIELWAKDIYKAVADAWGEDNIIDFSVHLDESSPHIHCLVTPIMYDEKKQKMRIKYRDTFGGDANKLDAIHDYLAEVNKKWGLVRGESVSATNAQHIPRDEWYRQLQAESRELEIANGKLELDIRRKENAVKGLKTMIENLTHQKSEVENKIHEVEKQLEQQNGEHSELSKELEQLKSQLSTLEFKLTDKREDKLPKQANLHRTITTKDTLANRYKSLIAQLPEFDFYTSGNDALFSEDAPMCHQIEYIISHIENELRKAKVAEKSKDYITATNIYEELIANGYWKPEPYNRLLYIYDKAGLTNGVKELLVLAISFFENQQKKQKQELLRLADKYKSRAYAEAKINQGKTVAYFDGFFEIYMPFPDIDVWKRILADTSA